MIKNVFVFSLLGLIVAGANATQTVVVTGTPPPSTSTNYNPSTTGSTSGDYGASFGFSGGYKDAAIAQARQSCINDFSNKQKKLCDDKKEQLFRDHIAHCNTLGTGGTIGIAAGGVVGVGGTIVALAGGPIGWGILFAAVGAGGAAGGAVVQQEGNYGCRDDANQNYQYNTQACINYQTKIVDEFCSKIR
ncbi:MAG: hypothetical protein B0W54_19290 [Cellvibrio sp. 79]|nr:MAG: hypothetical protein B0W54_19290 [Cellvibrio sp. 79]